ncbi:MAG: hypothetical protein R6V19_15045 [Armatimonadota bacterium]
MKQDAATEAALDYVRKCREEGISDHQIASELCEADWDDETIEDLLRRAESQEAQAEGEPESRETRQEDAVFRGVVVAIVVVAVGIVLWLGPYASDTSSSQTQGPAPAEAPKKDVADTPQQQANTSDTARQESAEHSTSEEANETSDTSSPQTQGATSTEAPHSTTPDDDKTTEAWVMAKEFVKEGLKSPGTADFGSVWGGDWQSTDDCIEHIGDGKYRAEGWVDAENTFGATVRIEFVCEVEHVGGDEWQCNSLDLEQRE